MLNKKALADSLGVESHTIIRWERYHTDEPTSENLSALVSALNYPRDFFFGPDLDEPEDSTTSFRSQTAMTAAIRDAALAAGALGFLISDWVAHLFELPLAKLPDLHLYKPELAAQALREEWGLGEKPISNMIHLLESKGVRVFALAENTTAVNAYSLWRNGTPFVFLNTFKTAECSRFDAAHELAHLVLHQDGKMKGREAEEAANQFASAFLMPMADVLSVVPRVQHIHQLLDAKTRWKVSLAALNYRVHKLGITSAWKNRDFCIEISRRGYNKSEPNGIPRERSLVWDKVMKTLWSEKTTHQDIADALHLPLSEVIDLLFGILHVENEKPLERRALEVLENPQPLDSSSFA